MSRDVHQAVAEGREAIIAWIQREQTAWLALPDELRNAPPMLPQSRIDQINGGRWPVGLPLPDWHERHNFFALQEYLAAKFAEGCAGQLSEYFQSLAAQVISGQLQPVAKKTGKATNEHMGVALHCIAKLKSAGVTPILGHDRGAYEGRPLGSWLVADALELKRTTVEKWWKDYRKAEKSWDG
jgi:hypothetical protein